MTEYDYSPDAWERYIETQHRIARWVDGTLVQKPCNAFAPATPHIKFLELQDEEKRQRKEAKKAQSRKRHSYDEQARKHRSDRDRDEDYEDHRTSSHSSSKYRQSSSQISGSSSRHERTSSRHEYSPRDRDRDYDREKERERRSSSRAARYYESDQEVPREKSKTTHNTPASTRASTPTKSSRPRASSHSVAKPTRAERTKDLSLDLSREDDYYYRYPRYSSGGNSSNTRPSSGSTTNGWFSPQQNTPTSAPTTTRHAPQPIRSYTLPMPAGYGYASPVPTSKSPDPSRVPQLPHSAYTSSPTKPNHSTSLLKRMFTGLTLNKHSTSPKPKQPATAREKESFVLPPNGGGRRVSRKRSISF
ncbi:hypothetical protein FA15DRAFT_654623 [Coprinopsis marcescibilis]|uniref:Uncharacterized protein n=1 Tax=Coprinopsis marcescibilis TaxID=230819 RepID=A0A5C3L1R8_COPMA|nr:hypothetical protein FA15DRAFT_654623 [Coprinopsis marcescibilis]